MVSSMWGNDETQYFFQLTPDRILDAVEASGLRCTGRCLTLNSMENRVYEIEIEVEDKSKLRSPSEAFRIAKFYRPGRWSEAQILEEHQFLQDLQDAEILTAPAEPFADGRTLHKLPDIDIWYTVFPKVGGRNPDELSDAQFEQLGRLLGRMHNVGASREARHRLSIDPATYGRKNLEFLLDADLLPQEFRNRYESAVGKICDIVTPWFEQTESQRIHGDAHFGNLLWTDDRVLWVDFDDMVRGPCVQDMWLVIPGRDDYAQRQLYAMIDGYEQMRDFDHRSLRLIEPLRALRLIHFNAWIGKRWSDPAFPRAFAHYGGHTYWQQEVQTLEEQLELIEETQRKDKALYL